MTTKKEVEIAEHLSQKGIEFSDQLKDENAWYLENLDATYFAIASAISLTWTKHAQYTDGFIEYASSYIDGTINKDIDVVNENAFRFGAEELDKALVNYRRYYATVKNIMPDFYKCDAQDLSRLQTRLLNKLDQLRVTNKVSGIGPWLFTGPFKIIIGDQDRMWGQTGIDAIILPTGLEVDRGIIKLKNEGYSFMKDFDINWLDSGSGSLLDSYSTYLMVHAHLVKIGQITNTPAIHINSALYLYGQGKA